MEALIARKWGLVILHIVYHDSKFCWKNWDKGLFVD